MIANFFEDHILLACACLSTTPLSKRSLYFSNLSRFPIETYINTKWLSLAATKGPSLLFYYHPQVSNSL